MKTRKIKVKQHSANFTKTSKQVEEEILKKLKIFDWVFKFNHITTYDENQKLDAVLRQIDMQYDCNEREFTFSITI